MTDRQTILLVGCGRMGGAMARAWAPNHDVAVYDPNAPAPAGTRRLAQLDQASIPAGAAIILAVKPQMAPSVLPDVAPLASGKLVVSIMAGLGIERLEQELPGARVIRAMPNTPAAIGKGISGLAAAGSATAADRALAEMLLAACGEVVWLGAESEIDLVTAVSGSGPAYFFRFAEALAKAGAEAGLDPELAMRLARATFTGAAALAAQDGRALSELRTEVTSPGGTTAAGLARLDAAEIDRILADVVRAAAARSRELGG
jgi:pyrroline-5-carboxylate reductase